MGLFGGDFWKDAGSALLTGGLSLVGDVAGGMIAGSAQDRANEANVALTRENMAWQERMANTAHQRQVADLRLAGLNPILSARYGGASSPSVSSAQVESLAPIYSGTATKMSDRAMNIRNQIADLQVKKTQAEANSAQAVASRASANMNNTSAIGVAFENQLKKEQLPGKIAEGKAEASIPWWARSASKWYRGSVDNLFYLPEKASDIYGKVKPR